MIQSRSNGQPYATSFSNGRAECFTDIAVEKGGSGGGFRPHDLLEAALATCITITVRMYADAHGIALAEVETEVTLDRTDPDLAVFRYEVRFSGADLTNEDRQKLLRAAAACPVHKTLMRQIRVVESAAVAL